MYKVICMIPDQCYLYWTGNGWSEVENEAKLLSNDDCVETYKRHAHKGRGVSKDYTIRLVDGEGKTVMERKGKPLR